MNEGGAGWGQKEKGAKENRMKFWSAHLAQQK